MNPGRSGTAGMAMALALLAGWSGAAWSESLYVPLLSYRTGAFAGSGIPMANGTRDYLTLLNQRDGGIGGVKIEVEECETGYDTKRGVECYEQVKSKRPVVTIPFSTGITLQLIPRASVDKIPMLTLAYGLSAAAVGDVFPWTFNPPATYWDCLSMVLRYIGDEEGSLERLKGKKIGFIFLDGGYGREPLPLLELFAKQYGFEVKLYPVAPAEVQNQSAQWLGVRRDRPDWMIMWGWGAMNPAAVKEAAKIGYPMNRFIANWWAGGEADARPAGQDAKGFRALNWHAVGADAPALQDIRELLVAKGLSKAADSDVGESIYNRGIYNGVLIAEAIRTAQQLAGKKIVDGEDVRRGFESLRITAERWKEIGLPDYAAPVVNISCSEHSGHHASYVQQWDGDKWVKISGWFEPMTSAVRPLLEAAAKEYAEKNTGWPKRTEPCDKAP